MHYTISFVVILAASFEARSMRMVADAPGIPTAGMVIIPWFLRSNMANINAISSGLRSVFIPFSLSSNLRSSGVIMSPVGVSFMWVKFTFKSIVKFMFISKCF